MPFLNHVNIGTGIPTEEHSKITGDFTADVINVVSSLPSIFGGAVEL